MSEVMYVTHETLEQLKNELQKMKSVDRLLFKGDLRRRGKKVI